MIRPMTMVLGAALLLGACADARAPEDPAPASESVPASADELAVSDVATSLTVYKSPG